MRKFLIFLLVVTGIVSISRLFIVGNERHPFVRKINKEIKHITNQKDEFIAHSIQYRQELRHPEQFVSTWSELPHINITGIVLYNSWTTALQSQSNQEALRYFDKSLEFDTGNAQTRVNRGIVLARMGQLDQAMESFDVALGLEPQNDQTWIKKWVIYFNTWDYASAIQSFGQALVIDSGHENIRINQGLAHYFLHQYSQALDSYDMAIQINNQNPNSRYNKAIIFMVNEDYSQAMDAYQKVISLDPDRSNIYYEHAMAAYYSGANQLALKSFLSAYKSNPWNHDLLKNIGKIYFDLEKYSESINFFNQYLRFYPNSADVRGYRWNALYRQSKFEEALLSYKKSIKLDPGNQLIKDNILKTEWQILKH